MNGRSLTHQPRHAPGTPAGGQWSAKSNPEADLDLSADEVEGAAWIPDDDYFLVSLDETPVDPGADPEPGPAAIDGPIPVDEVERARDAVRSVAEATPYSPEQHAAAQSAEALVTELGSKIAEQVDLLAPTAESELRSAHPDDRTDWSVSRSAHVRQESTKMVLAQFRAFGFPGGEHLATTDSAHKPAVAVLNEASKLFPRAWLRASNENTARYPLSARVSTGRAHYMPSRAKWEKDGKREQRHEYTGYPAHMVPKNAVDVSYQDGGPDGVKRASWTVVRQVDQTVRRVVAEITVPSPGRWGSEASRVGVHELTHRLEETNPHLVHIEQAFLARRCRDESGKQTPLRPYGRSRSEKVREGGFADPYVGKWYQAGFTEVLSTGTEAVFHGSYGGLVGDRDSHPDHDHRAFVLGMLAVG